MFFLYWLNLSAAKDLDQGRIHGHSVKISSLVKTLTTRINLYTCNRRDSSLGLNRKLKLDLLGFLQR